MAQRADAYKKKLWVNAGIIAASFLVGIVAVYIIGGDIAARAENIASGRSLIAERSAKVNALSSLKQQAPEAREIEERLKRLLPREEELLSLSEFLDGTARSAGVDVSSSFSGSPSAPTDSAPGSVNVDIEARGELRGIESFLSAVEFQGTRFLLEVASVNISQSGGTYQANMTAKVFFSETNQEGE